MSSKTAGGTYRPATLDAVARQAGVSVMTVSNVVNGRFKMMSEATRARVERALAKLNYRRHTSARSLRLSQRFSIGMVIVDPSSIFLADPFITHVVAGLTNVLGEHGFSLTLVGTPAARLEQAVILKSNSTDGLCVMLSGPLEERRRCLRRLAALRQPLVLVQENIKGIAADLCSVRQDDYGGAQELGRRVLARGARELVVLTPSLDWPAVEARVRGIRDIARSHPGTRVTPLSCGDETLVATQAALAAHARARGMPHAILAANDQMGIAALKWLQSRGARVPEDVLLTGFNAFEFRQYSDPAITSVRSAAYGLGDVAGRALMQRLTGKRYARREIVLPVALVDGATA
jgi:DNA-binding LacI/PurR family transcriptional regulator